jgi:peptidoglycan hydrolase CwlO-like protein
VATPPTSSFYTDASGQTFSVSNYDYRRLQQMKLGLEAEETLVEEQQDSLKALEQEVSRARKKVNRYSQASVNSFNAKISNYNNRLENAQAAIDRFNRKVDEFNAELRRVGTPMR